VIEDKLGVLDLEIHLGSVALLTLGAFLRGF
jgi:hypothetical protein